MVIFTDWCLFPVIPRNTCGLPMDDEDTGLEAVASPMAGYLGKVQERVASLDYCPWCSSKGRPYPLRSYHINLEESITLCTNPQCLFPLVSRPLEDVLTNLVPVEPATESKRRSPQTTEDQHPIAPSPKRLRLNEQDSPRSPTIAPSDIHNIDNYCNVHSTEAHVENINGILVSPHTNQLEENDPIISKALDATACTDAENVPIKLDTGVQDPSKSFTTDNHQVLSSQVHRQNEDHSCISAVDRDCSVPDGGVFPNKNKLPEQTEAKPILPTEDGLFVKVFHSKREDASFTETNTEELVLSPAEIFWRNADNLCWLDSLLVALVNLKSLRKLKPKVDPEQSPLWTLLTGYEEACAAIQSQQRIEKNGCLKIPNPVLHKINGDLETLRMSIFNILQPKLQCKLGQDETPVFALPLLVKMDSWLETLFQSKFYWDFKCTKCRSSMKQNVVKTLPTFTNIVPDWHPLRAVHLAPCNNCHRKNQRRKMVLQGVPPVFALHFVEGLHDNNIQIYSFTINKRHYSVSAIIQYISQHKHFVTWVHRPDGFWVEFDDLKHPHCKSYKTLPVPAQEIHVVFWEEEEERCQESRACSPSTTFTESSPSIPVITQKVTDLDILEEDLLPCSPDQSLLNPQHDSDLTDAITEQDTTIMAGVDTSIGSTTLLDAFEGLTHDDIITLTLVDMKKDAKNLNDDEIEGVNEDLKDVMHKAMEDVPTPDSSSTFGPKETNTETREEEVDLSPVSDPEDNLSDDPTFEPKSEKGQKRSRTAASKQAKTRKAGNQKGKVASKATKNTPVSPTDSESPTVSSKPSSPVSSTVSTHENVSDSEQIPQAPPVVKQQQKGWSQLLKRSLGHIQNNTSIFNSVQKAVTQEPTVSIQSIPRQQTDAVPIKAAPKLGLRMEEKGGLPLKAAEMYGAFGSKNSEANVLNVNTIQSPVQKPLLCNTVLNSINTSIIGLPSHKTSLKKTKLPSGVSETEALRYKLMKKLQAKKKKLAKLNKLLGQQGGASLIPDSTNSNSPNTVTSSTLDEEFLSGLLSPATTITSTLSPDSTDFLEMLANGQEATFVEGMPSNTVVQQSTVADRADLLDEFMSQAATERPSEMEAEALSALDLFL